MSIVQFSTYSYQTDLFQMPAVHFSTVNFFPGFKELSQKNISWGPTQQARATVNYNNC